MKANKVFAVLVLITTILLTGCTSASVHDHYTHATIIDKYYNAAPMQFVNPELVKNPAWYNYDYFIRYSDGSDRIRVDRVSKDVYASIFINHTYTLEWGYVDDMTAISKDYGYVSATNTGGAP